MTRTGAWTLGLLALGMVALIVLYGRNSDADAEALAEWYSNGQCFVCSRPLVDGDDIASYLDDPKRGLAHFTCIAAGEGPFVKVD